MTILDLIVAFLVLVLLVWVVRRIASLWGASPPLAGSARVAAVVEILLCVGFAIWLLWHVVGGSSFLTTPIPHTR